MIENQNKTKDQLLKEVARLNKRVAELERCEEEINSGKLMQEALQSIATNFSSVTGLELFEKVCRHLSKILQLDYAFVGELNSDKDKVLVKAGIGKGEPIEDFEYDLADTPCNNVMGNSACSYPSNVQELFPKDHLLAEMGIDGYAGIPLFNRDGGALGILVLMHSKPISNQEISISLLQIFSDRIAVEIERLQAEEGLKISEEKYQSIIENLPIVSWQTSEEGETVFVSSNIKQVYGYSASEIYEKGAELWLEIIHPDDIERVTSNFSALLSKGTPYKIDYRLKRKDGEWIWINDSASTVKTINGKRYAFGAFSEVTQQKQIDQELQESKEKFSAAFDYAPYPIAIYNFKSGQRLMVNNSFCETFGYSKKELLKGNIFTNNKAVNQKEFEIAVKTALLKGSLEEFPFSMYTKSGKIRYVLLKGTKLYPNNNEIFITSLVDITKRKQVEEALLENEKNLEEAQRIAGVGSWEWDLETDTVIWSKELYNINGLDLNKSVPSYEEQPSIYTPESFNKLDIAVRVALDKGTPYSLELEMIRTEGMIRQVKARGEPVSDSTGHITGLRGTVQDITKQKRAEDAIKASEKKFKSLIKYLSSPLCLIDNSDKFVYLNDRFLKDVGYSLEEIPSLDEWWIKAYPDEIYRKWVQDDWGAAFERAKLEGGAIDLNTYNVKCKDGKTRVFIIAGIIISEGFFATFIDVTEQKKAENSLRDSEEKFSKTFYEAPIPFIVLDLKTGQRRFVNNAFLDHFGYTEKELLKGDFQNKPIVIDIDQRNIAIEKLKKQERISNFPLKIRANNGAHLDTLASAVVLDLKEEKLAIVSFVDVTKQKIAEQKIKESEERFSKAFYEHPSPMQITNMKTGERVLINKSALTIIGFSEKDFLQANAFEEFDKVIDQEMKVKAMKKLLSEGFLNNYPVDGRTKFGDIIHLLVNANLLDLANGEQAMLTYTDITKIVKAETELKKTLVELQELKNQIEAENVYLQEEIKTAHNFEEIIGKSKVLTKMLKQIEQVAKTDSTVLVLGETGTGKELVARAIHSLSERKEKSLVKVNCSALPAELIESELFGHEKGAFTGAFSKKIGRFELAHRGTIFLDEIGDLPLNLQSRLLRVIQESEFERVGSSTTLKVNIRVIAATNRNLEKLVLNGEFRQDLYYRLNVFPITCPLLKDRIGDIPLLVNHFVNKYSNKLHRKVDKVHQTTLDTLKNYYWPGNIRELEHVIERALVLSKDDTLRIGKWFDQDSFSGVKNTKMTTLEENERVHINEVLDQTNWRIRGKNGAAEILGIKPTTLDSRMRKLGINR